MIKKTYVGIFLASMIIAYTGRAEVSTSESIIMMYTPELQAHSTKPMVIKAFLSTCPHCQRMKPVYERIANKLHDQYLFSEFEVKQQKDLADSFKISSIPVFIFIKNNQEVGRIKGAMSQEKLEEAIHTYLDSASK